MVPFPYVFRLLLTAILWTWLQAILVAGRETSVGSEYCKRGPSERKPVGSCQGRTANQPCHWSRARKKWGYSSIFWFTYQPCPMGKWNSCLAISTVLWGDIFSLIIALVLRIIVQNPHRQPVDLPVELPLFYLNVTLTREWATFFFLLHFAISNSKNHMT